MNLSRFCSNCSQHGCSGQYGQAIQGDIWQLSLTYQHSFSQLMQKKPSVIAAMLLYWEFIAHLSTLSHNACYICRHSHATLAWFIHIKNMEGVNHASDGSLYKQHHVGNLQGSMLIVYVTVLINVWRVPMSYVFSRGAQSHYASQASFANTTRYFSHQMTKHSIVLLFQVEEVLQEMGSAIMYL